MNKNQADIIAERLQEEIFNGKIANGDRLDEVSLAKKYGVSRTPLREALRKIAHSGLAELIPRRGTFVRQPSLAELIEMFEVMAEIEAVCGRLAAKRISDEALAELHDANEKCQKAVEAQDPDSYYTENARFHRIIYEESGNKFLAIEAGNLHKRLQPFRRHQLRLRGRMAQSLSEHKAVLETLERGDSEATANALRGHVAIQGEKFHSLVAMFRNAAE
ncbi:MAG: GntR family transcriptional regulator [Rhodobacteraceae bacterium]|nr:GntR family transcriptional regulator [Paracoccaceae bacterium]